MGDDLGSDVVLKQDKVVRIPFDGKVALRNGGIIALIFDSGLTEDQYEHLRRWWEQNCLFVIRRYSGIIS